MKAQLSVLDKYYNNPSLNYIEIGIDEAGRGPMFGRVYTAGVVLPKDDVNFKYELLKDSKKFHSEKKINEVYEYIKENAVVWDISYNDEKTIDKINIRQSVLSSMHSNISNIIKKYDSTNITDTDHDYYLLVDGNDFKPYMRYENNELMQLPHICIEGGDNKYCAIAAASILAKVERDKYINELCELHPELKEKYNLHKNKGYGTRAHMDGIKTHGITQWHRKTYGICKEFA